MPTPRKNETIEQLAKALRSSRGIFLTDFAGLPVGLMTELRKRCAAESVGFTVVKNTLANRAAQMAGLPDIGQWLNGPTAIAFAEDPSRAVKLLQQFVREVREANGKPEIKTGLYEGAILDAAQMNIIATLPAPEIVRARFLGLLQAPASKFVYLLSAAPGSLVRALDQRRQKLEDGESGSAESETQQDAPEGQTQQDAPEGQ
jgi:large subunit ribosomal protein L10